MAVGQPAGVQRQQHRRGGEQRQQQAHGPGAVALVQ
jgi:hypothetical protein